MRSPNRRSYPTAKPPAPSPPVQRHAKAPYSKPKVEAAGSVFQRTKIIGSGTQDIFNGSQLL